MAVLQLAEAALDHIAQGVTGHIDDLSNLAVFRIVAVWVPHAMERLESRGSALQSPC